MSNKFKYYPTYDDPNFYEKVINKKEFYINKIPEDRRTEEELCRPKNKFQLLPQQAFLKNYINSDTPYSNILIFHGTGVGKTISSVAIAENFTEMVEKYDGKIYVLVPGNEVKVNYKNKGILSGVSAEKYITQEERQILKDLEKIDTPSAQEEIKKLQRKIEMRIKKLGFYKILGYETFVNRTIGRIVKDKNGKEKKDINGNVIREITGNPIFNLNNSVLIVDEAHRIVNENDFGEAIREILKKSRNYKLILMTATPMFHGPETIIELLNLLNMPKPASLTHDMVFGKFDPVNKVYELTKDAIDVVKQYAKGYISYSRGIDPTTFPTRVDVGEVPKPFNISKDEQAKYTKLVRCEMSELQLKTYIKKFDGTRSKNNIYLSNMVLPNPEDPKVGLYMNEDFQRVIYNAPAKWLKENKINVIDSADGVIITGEFLQEKNLKKYSNKYYTLLQNIKNSFGEASGPAFIYIEDIVGVGLTMIQQILLQNGFIEYIADTQKNYNDNTLDAVSGKRYGDIKNKETFQPAKFISIYGESDLKRRSKLIERFNNPDNADGNKIKIILGSRVARESIDFKNIRQIHILNAQWEFGSLEQIIGRGIRFCSHMGYTGEKRKVYVYKYVSSLPAKNGKYEESIEERLYREEEKIDIITKQIERALKESAVDCELNKHGNVFPNEIEDSKKCETHANKKLCTPACDYQDCNLKCDYQLPKRDKYNYPNELEPKALDKSTYTIHFAQIEIENIKNIINDLYKKSYVYTAETLLNEIFSNKQYKYLEKNYIMFALNEMISNKEIITDRYDIDGYIIYRGNYYIFQPKNRDDLILMNQRELPDLYKFKESKSIEDIIKDKIGSEIMQEKASKLKYNISTVIDKFSSDYQKIMNKDYQKVSFYNNYLNGNKMIQEIMISYLLGHIPSNVLQDIFKKIVLDNKLIKESFYKFVYDKFKHFIIHKKDVDSSFTLTGDDSDREILGYYISNNLNSVYIKNEWKSTDKIISESFIRSAIDKQLIKNVNENEYIGYLYETKDGNVLKLRPKINVKKGEKIDKRKIPSGFICQQSSNKGLIVSIAKDLEYSGKKSITIFELCQNIEFILREYQLKNKGGKMWLYEWWQYPY